MTTPINNTTVRYYDDEMTERLAVIIATTPEQCAALAGQPEGAASVAVFFPSPTAPTTIVCPDVVQYSATPAARCWTPLS